MNIGDMLHSERIKRNLTQEEISRKMSISQGTYSRIERGIQEPSFYHLLQFRIHLNISIDDYIDYLAKKNHRA